VLLRITNVRGVNLDVFDFDYDLTWAAFFLNGHEKIYGRYGGRDASSADGYLTLSGLKHAMGAALAAYRHDPDQKPAKESRSSRPVEQYPAAKALKADACIHCHQVYDFRRAERKAAGTWRLDEVWVYPLPENLGLALDSNQGNRVKSIGKASAAERAGLRAGDELEAINGQSVASFADVQYALHRAPMKGTIRVAWRRDGAERTADLDLANGWRKTDIGWRASTWGLEPSPCVYGANLSAADKKDLGLPEKSLAFRQGNFVPGPAKRAGIRANDVIFGIDRKKLEMTMLQFNAYVRLNYKVGDRITFNLLRDGKKLEVPMVLPKTEN
jgi:hypothetical protein